VKSIMELHGGTVTVQSVPRHGTTITLRFPCQGTPEDDTLVIVRSCPCHLRGLCLLSETRAPRVRHDKRACLPAPVMGHPERVLLHAWRVFHPHTASPSPRERCHRSMASWRCDAEGHAEDRATAGSQGCGKHGSEIGARACQLPRKTRLKKAAT